MVKTTKCLLAVGLLANSYLALGVTAKPAKVPVFSIEISPSGEDWRYFHQMLPASRAELWQDHKNNKKTLKDWSWGWRLGWVQSCIKDKAPYCNAIIRDALKDKALVVRAEAATQIGRAYEGTGNPAMIRALTDAYNNTRNLRRGKPMYVQRRILYAIKQIGGGQASATGLRLASENAATNDYWKKLNRL